MKGARRLSRHWVSGSFILLGGLLVLPIGLDQGPVVGNPVYAQGHGGGGNHTGGGHSGGHSDSHGDAHAGAAGHEGGGGRGRGQQADHRGRIGRSSGGDDAVQDKIFRDRDVRPVWARDALPQVELGRLNVARAPEHVLARALMEAEQVLATGELPHSPLQNLALYQQALSDQTKFDLGQAAGYLGVAADKGLAISEDTVRALNLILGLDVDLSAYRYNGEVGIGAFAAHADAVRGEIAATHDHAE